MCGVSIKTTPFCIENKQRIQAIDGTFIKTTLQIWGQIKRNCEIKNYLMVLREIKEDPDFFS